MSGRFEFRDPVADRLDPDPLDLDGAAFFRGPEPAVGLALAHAGELCQVPHREVVGTGEDRQETNGGPHQVSTVSLPEAH